jgi:hypothetical protein
MAQSSMSSGERGVASTLAPVARSAPKSKIIPLLVAVALLAAGVGVWWWLGQSGSSVTLTRVQFENLALRRDVAGFVGPFQPDEFGTGGTCDEAFKMASLDPATLRSNSATYGPNNLKYGVTLARAKDADSLGQMMASSIFEQCLADGATIAKGGDSRAGNRWLAVYEGPGYLSYLVVASGNVLMLITNEGPAPSGEPISKALKSVVLEASR